MSVVSVQLGQCGNQIGTDLFNTIMKDASSPPSYSSCTSLLNQTYGEEVFDRFFFQCESSKNYTARAVLVDTEPKVINQSIMQSQDSGMFI